MARSRSYKLLVTTGTGGGDGGVGMTNVDRPLPILIGVDGARDLKDQAYSVLH